MEEFHPTIELYAPRYERLSRPSGYRRAHPILSPVYPGYIFARPNLSIGEHIHLIRTPIRAYFIRFGPDIELIPDRVILELRRLESLKQLTPPPKDQKRYYPGQSLNVHFPTADVPAILIKLIADARALVDTALGRATVPIHAIESVPQKPVAKAP